MEMSPAVMLAVLGAALLHAGWNALLKASPDKELENAALALGRVVIGLLALPWMAPLAPGAWPWLAASVAVHIVYFWALAGAYRLGDLSFSYPIMRGGGPVLVTAAGVVLLGETLHWQDLAAVMLICAGILAFAVPPRGGSRPPRQALLFALGNAVVIGAYTLIDAQGVRQAGTALGYILWMLLINGLVQIGLGLRARGARAVLAYSAQHWLRVPAGALATIASYAIALWAMTQASVAVVAALREVSVVFAAVIGALFLGERFTRARMLATAAVLLGLVVLRL
jgi:drug/metabolite transporter (DMT)-like permease